MRPEEAQKLLGGYATGTLTDAEQQALFAAALEDQALFDALANEQALRDLLHDPGARAELLAALEELPHRWWNWRPVAAVLAMAGVAALAVVLVKPRAPVPKPTIVAELRPSTPPLPGAPPSPAPQAKRDQGPPNTAQPERAHVESRKAFKAPLSGSRPGPEIVNIPDAPAARPLQQDARAGSAGALGGVVGGVPGGVVGGLIDAPPPPIPRAEATPPPPAVLPMFAQAPKASPPSERKVELRTSARFEAAQTSARALFLGTPPRSVRVQTLAATGSAAPPFVGVRYTFLRKEGAEFIEASPDDLKQGDTVELRLTANTNGYLSIGGETPIAVTAMQPYVTPPLAPDQAEVRVVFSRQPQTALTVPATLATETYDRETFVVNTAPAPAVGFIVTLKRK